MRNRIIAAVIAIAVSCMPATGYAGDDRERALQLGNEGLELYNQESYEEALERFSDAESLVHSPVFVLYMARIDHRRGRWVRAIAHYKRVLGEPLAADAPDTWRRAREEATVEHQRLVEEVPTLRIVIDAPPSLGAPSSLRTPDEVSIWIDGKSVQRWQEPIRVDPGKHQIAAQYLQRSQTKRIEVASGEDAEVTLDFTGVASPGPPAPQPARHAPRIVSSPDEETEDAGPSDQKIAGYALLAIGGAAALSFGGVSIALAVQDRQIASQCLERVCPDELEDDIGKHDQLSKAAIGLAIGFAVTLVTGGIVTGTAPETIADGAPAWIDHLEILMLRATLGWLFLLLITAASCGFEIDEDLCLTDDHCDDDEVCTLHNRCFPCSGAQCPAHERCAEDADCSSDEACAEDGLCRTRCVVDAQCAHSGGVCKEPVCGDPIGAPCSDYYTPCAGDECVDTDNRLSPVPAYCTQTCMPEQCPDGYECVQSVCRKISEREVCNYPDVNGYCAACVWEYCYSYLDECCEGQICGDVYQQIDLCDQDTTYTSCMPLASPSNFAATSEELRDCIALLCNRGECLPEQ